MHCNLVQKKRELNLKKLNQLKQLLFKVNINDKTKQIQSWTHHCDCSLVKNNNIDSVRSKENNTTDYKYHLHR